MGMDARTQAVSAALADLRERLSVTVTDPGPQTHVVLSVAHLEDPESIRALGIYLTGLVANVVQIDLTLVDRLLGIEIDATAQLTEDVHSLIGASNAVSSTFRDNLRNPWLAEGIAHLLVSLPEQAPGPCIPGRVHVLTLPHDKASQQGLDTVAVYDEEDNALAVCIGEAKASERFPGLHLGRSVKLYREIDQGVREYQIRTVVNMLAGYLEPDVKERVVPFFWQGKRLYLPTIAYLDACGFTPDQNRPRSLGTLLVPADRRRLIVVPLADFHVFFDQLANAVRAAIEV
jgi:hypothetical protein